MRLSFRERLGESVKKGGLSHNEIHHPSRAYERHFEGYIERAQDVPGKKRARAVRTYVDSFQIEDLSPHRRILLRVLLAALYVVALLLFLYGASRSIVANTVWFVTLPQAVCLLLLGWTALCLYRFCTAPAEMTVRQHRLAVVWLRRVSCAAGVALLVLTLTYLLHAALCADGRMGSLLCAFLCTLACACLWGVFARVRALVYIERPNPLAREDA